jgi:hypothetical protein
MNQLGMGGGGGTSQVAATPDGGVGGPDPAPRRSA